MKKRLASLLIYALFLAIIAGAIWLFRQPDPLSAVIRGFYV